MQRTSASTSRSDVWAERLVRWLDDGFRIPGSEWRIGLDGIVGLLLPAAGDALSAVASLSLFVLAYQRNVPRSVLLRMVVNIAIDALVGALPLLGDVFDFAWKANRRNLTLIQRAAEDEERSANVRGRNVFWFAALLAFLVAVLAAPLALSLWILVKLFHAGAS